jgi:hypothetical protein
VETAITEITAATKQPAKDDAAIAQVVKLATDVDDGAKAVEAAAARADTGAKATADAAGASPSAEAKKLVAEAEATAKAARATAMDARTKADAAAKKARDYAKAETQDAQMFVAAADTAIATGDFTTAKVDLDKAVKAQRAAGTRNAGIDFSYAQLYDKMASRSKDPATKLKLLQQAKQSYETFARGGTGKRVKRANDRAAELAEEIKELEGVH